MVVWQNWVSPCLVFGVHNKVFVLGLRDRKSAGNEFGCDNITTYHDWVVHAHAHVNGCHLCSLYAMPSTVSYTVQLSVTYVMLGFQPKWGLILVGCVIDAQAFVCLYSDI
jgi:hypothetical protein